MDIRCKVRQVRYKEPVPLEVGSLLAKQGSWQRKYEVTNITELNTYDTVKEFAIEIKFLGEFWATGKVKHSKTQPRREMVVATHYMQQDQRWAELRVPMYYVHVVPV